MEAWRDGDIASFDVLFDRHKDMLYRYLNRQTGNHAHAEEVFQEVWTALIKNRKSYTVRAKFRTYLFHIAHSRLIDYYRQFDKHSALSYEEHDIQSGQVIETHEQPEGQVDTQHKLASLMQLLDKLPAAQREIFLLHEESGLGLSEIAETLGISRDTVKSRLRYALDKLRKGMRHLS